ncbi:MAG TPA: rRNA maturation RNase YbeY [Anaerolineaceae bacterium]|uniref:Endoribonuclease YbeY n=1 Tax=Anaerolinea thermophila TaxID=167964 RepID=A0A101FY31_9CHLR|nr:MAG: Endoribonuclease YbeY [Anaerolinea thermophila]HAF61238.1 rRNA maturation RNase YbeY [Anaerolineaceae bacterium]
MIDIIYSANLKSQLNATLFERRIFLAQQLLGLDEEIITVKVCDDEEMHALNKMYRDIDDTTDVLSFNLDFDDPGQKQLVLGDIIISLIRANQQAIENEHSLEDEMTLLAIHGLLHLMGHDHALKKEKQIMFSLQENIYQQVVSGDYES